MKRHLRLGQRLGAVQISFHPYGIPAKRLSPRSDTVDLNMPVLPDAWSLIMNVLLNAPVAWQSPAEIAAVLGRGQEETTDLLCDLDVAGWVVVWEVKSGPLVTLSALAAERLKPPARRGPGRSATPADGPSRAYPGPAVRSPRPKNVCLSERAASLEFKTDPAMSPDMTAEWAEHAEAMALNRQGQWTTRPGNRVEPPRPTVLLGLSQTPWPGPARRALGPGPGLPRPAATETARAPDVLPLLRPLGPRSIPRRRRRPPRAPPPARSRPGRGRERPDRAAPCPPQIEAPVPPPGPARSRPPAPEGGGG